MTTKKSVLISLPVIALIILGAVFYSASSNAHSWKYNPWQKALSVTFAPETATITLAPGETKTIEVTATIDCKDTRRQLTTAVSPELAPYVSVTPTTIPKCKRTQGNHNYQANRHWWQFWNWWKKDSGRNWRQKKQNTTTVTLNITADIPETIEPQTLSGSVWLEGWKVRSVRLPVKVNIETIGYLPASENEIRFIAQPNWELSYDLDTPLAYILSPESSMEVANGNLLVQPDLIITILENPNRLLLSEFVNSYQNSWFDIYQEQAFDSISGYDAVIYDDSSADISHEPTFAAFVQYRNQVLLVTGNNTRESFDEFLSAIKIP